MTNCEKYLAMKKYERELLEKGKAIVEDRKDLILHDIRCRIKVEIIGCYDFKKLNDTKLDFNLSFAIKD